MLPFISCLAHVVNLAIEDFMKAVTQVAVTKSKQAIWDYDPSLEENVVSWGQELGLDVIAVIRTLAIKVRHHFIRNLMRRLIS